MLYIYIINAREKPLQKNVKSLKLLRTLKILKYYNIKNISYNLYFIFHIIMAKRILTWIKPSSDQIHIGNYFWAVRPLLKLIAQDSQNEWFFMIANMHTLTTIHDGSIMKQNTLDFCRLYIALMRFHGLSEQQVVIFNQASIPAHAQLWWILSCVTHMGFMERMHAYKDAVAKGKANEVWVGTFCYPILMAGDIVLYDADIVPVGQDQKQHVEFCRDIADRFNKLYWDTFQIPESYIDPTVAVVPGIDGRKMSKSYNNYLWLLDDEKTLRKKIKQITTASLPVEASKNPDECNVYLLTKLFTTPEEDKALRDRYLAGGMGYGEAKEFLTEKLLAFTGEIQKIYHDLTDEEIVAIIDRGTQKAYAIATKKINEINEKVGFVL